MAVTVAPLRGASRSSLTRPMSEPPLDCEDAGSGKRARINSSVGNCRIAGAYPMTRRFPIVFFALFILPGSAAASDSAQAIAEARAAMNAKEYQRASDILHARERCA